MKSVREYLLDCLQYLNDVQDFTVNLDESAFVADRKTQLAVIRAFEVLGEIIKRVPQETLDTQAQIDWRAIKGFRDVLIHQYDNIDLKIVWDAVGRVPAVKQAVDALLADLPTDDESDETP
jgi:uncharacterized protein with HEPN domain